MERIKARRATEATQSIHYTVSKVQYMEETISSKKKMLGLFDIAFAFNFCRTAFGPTSFKILITRRSIFIKLVKRVQKQFLNDKSSVRFCKSHVKRALNITRLYIFEDLLISSFCASTFLLFLLLRLVLFALDVAET